MPLVTRKDLRYQISLECKRPPFNDRDSPIIGLVNGWIRDAALEVYRKPNGLVLQHDKFDNEDAVDITDNFQHFIVMHVANQIHLMFYPEEKTEYKISEHEIKALKEEMAIDDYLF